MSRQSYSSTVIFQTEMHNRTRCIYFASIMKRTKANTFLPFDTSAFAMHSRTALSPTDSIATTGCLTIRPVMMDVEGHCCQGDEAGQGSCVLREAVVGLWLRACSYSTIPGISYLRGSG